MKKYNVKCPYCGCMNRHLFLGETRGWLECIECGSDVYVGGKVLVADLFKIAETIPFEDDIYEIDPSRDYDLLVCK